MEVYVKLKDILAMLPEDDIVGPKPTYLREKINQLTKLVVEIDDEEEVIA